MVTIDVHELLNAVLKLVMLELLTVVVLMPVALLSDVMQVLVALPFWYPSLPNCSTS